MKTSAIPASFLLSTFPLLITSQTCSESLQLFDNALVNQSPQFECFSCTPDPLTSISGSARCSDGDKPDLNITVSCSTDCQQQIDQVSTTCSAENEDFNLVASTKVATVFFSVMGSCDFGYTPTVCDQALIDYNKAIRKDFDTTDACIFQQGLEPPAQCQRVCTAPIQTLLEKCDKKNFLVRDVGTSTEQEIGTVSSWVPTNALIQDLVWSKLNEPCQDFVQSLITEPVDNGKGDDGNGLDVAPIVGGIVGALVVLVGGAAAFTQMRKARRQARAASRGEKIDVSVEQPREVKPSL